MAARMNLGELSADLKFNTTPAIDGAKRFSKTVQKTDAGLLQLATSAQKLAASVSAAFNEMISLAATQELAEKKLETAIRSRNGAYDVAGLKEYASALQQVTLYGDEVTLSTMAQLAAFTDTEDELRKLTPLVQDLATFSGRDLGSAARAVGMALNGQARGLNAAGISIDENTAKQLQLADRATRTAWITAKLAQEVGGLSRKAAQAAGGSLKQFDNALGDLKETLGGLLEQNQNAWFESLAPLVQGLDGWIKSLDEDTKNLVGTFSSFAGGALVAAAGLAAFAFALPSMTAGFAMLGSAIAALAPYIGAVVVQLGTVGIAAGVVWLAWSQMSDGVKDTVVNMGLAVFQAIHQIIDNTVGLIVRGAGLMLEKVGSMLHNSGLAQQGRELQEFKIEFDTTMAYFGVSAEDTGLKAGQKLIDGIKSKLKGLLPTLSTGGGDTYDGVGPPQALPVLPTLPSSDLLKLGESARVTGELIDDDAIALREHTEAMREASKVASRDARDWLSVGLGKLFSGIGGGDVVADKMAGALSSGSGFGSAVGAGIGIAAGGPVGASVGGMIGSIADAVPAALGSAFSEVAPDLSRTFNAAISAAGASLLTTPTMGFAPYIAAFFGALELGKQTRAWKEITQILDFANAELVAAFDPLVRAFKPLAYALVPLIQTFAAGLAVLVESALFDRAISRLFDVTLGTARAIAELQIVFAGFRIWMLEMLGQTGSDAYNAAVNAEYQAKLARNSLAGSYSDLMRAADGVTSSFNALSTSTLNLPSGYKLNSSVFTSQEGVAGSITIGAVYVQSESGAQFVNDMQQMQITGQLPWASRA